MIVCCSRLWPPVWKASTRLTSDQGQPKTWLLRVRGLPWQRNLLNSTAESPSPVSGEHASPFRLRACRSQAELLVDQSSCSFHLSVSGVPGSDTSQPGHTCITPSTGLLGIANLGPPRILSSWAHSRQCMVWRCQCRDRREGAVSPTSHASK